MENLNNEEVKEEVVGNEEVNTEETISEEDVCFATLEDFEKTLAEVRKLYRRQNIVKNTLFFMGGVTVGIAGVAMITRFAPASSKTNLGTELYLSTLNKKKENVTREDINLLRELFEIKAEFRTGLISNEEYVKRFETLGEI